jgi:hypothetical protein
MTDGWMAFTPSLWWPDDRAWVVGTEIDFDSTLVATSVEGAEQLLTDERLEAFVVPPDGILSENGDAINRR